MLAWAISIVSNYPLISIVVILGLVFYLVTQSKHHDNYPPMPCKPLPILGHATFLKPNPVEAMMRWKKQVGPIFSFYVGKQLYVCLSSLDILKEAMVKQADYFSERPNIFTIKAFSANENGELSGFHNVEWRERRSVSLQILRNFGLGKNWLQSKIMIEVEEYLKALSELKGKAENVKTLTHLAVSNVFCSILLGHRFDYDDEYFIKSINLLKDRVLITNYTSLLDIFPWLEYLPGDFFKARRLRQLSQEICKTFGKYHIEKFKNDKDAGDNDNFVKAYLREKEKRQNSGMKTGIDDKSAACVIAGLFTGGTDTSSTTVLWTLTFAVNYPDIQKKVYEEIKEVIGTERAPTLEDKPKMPYLNAFLMETLRLRGILPLAGPHSNNKSTTVAGYTIPKGSVIIPHLDGIMKDKETWGDPQKFRPERFIDKDGDLVVPEQYLPFGIGRRLCLGESLAKMELFLFLAALYQRFEILPEDPNNPPSMDPLIGVGVFLHPFKVRFIERVSTI